MSSFKTGLQVLLHRLSLVSLIVISAISCATRDVQDTSAGGERTFSADSIAADDNTVTGNSMAEDAGTNEISDSDFAGTYKLSGDPICSITLIIKKDSAGFMYTFSGSFTGTGRIGLERKDGQLYVYFNRAGCEGGNDSVWGIYSSGTILIRKDGNSAGNNSCFRDCDSKNLRFVRN